MVFVSAHVNKVAGGRAVSSFIGLAAKMPTAQLIMGQKS